MPSHKERDVSEATGQPWRWKFGFKVEKRDAWVGLYWNRPMRTQPRWLEVYICPLPFVLFWAKRTDV